MDLATVLNRLAPAHASDAWHELRQADGVFRPAWSRFAQLAPSVGDEPSFTRVLDVRAAQLARRVRRDGAVGDDGGALRWTPALLPVLIDAAEWAPLAQGLAQRAALLEAMLADLYGPQRLLHEGLWPPALLLRHPGYLPALQGCVPTGGRWMQVVAFDVQRTADGHWWVCAQHTQGPAGLGHVLHNRLSVSQQWPEVYRSMGVQHPAGGLRRLIDALDAVARPLADGAVPRLVLLTDGDAGGADFEQTYLARYLGLPPAAGSDLTVRGQRLFLKTIGGLEPVHGLLRWLRDDHCDPLELHTETAFGVPGLLQTVRAGTVAMANVPGTAFLESPAAHGFLPAICEALLGAPLALPSVPSWWCGEPAAWRDAGRDLAGKCLLATFPGNGAAAPDAAAFDPRDAHAFDPRDAHAFEARVRDAVAHDPDAWTLQAPLPPARALRWQAGTLGTPGVLLRVYAMAGRDGQWAVMPGALAHTRREDVGVAAAECGRLAMAPVPVAAPSVPSVPSALSVPSGASAWAAPGTLADGGAAAPAQLVNADRAGPAGMALDPAHDTWVMADGPGDSVALLPQRLSVDEVAERRSALASHTAEDLFWMGRHSERIDQQVRLARATLMRARHGGPMASAERAALQTLALRSGLVLGDARVPESAFDFAAALLAAQCRVGIDVPGPACITDNLASLAASARSLRERLSTELSGLVRSMRADFAQLLRDAGADAHGQVLEDAVLGGLDRLALQVAALTGLQHDRMTRDHGWRLLATGRLLERLIVLTGTLRVWLDSGALAAREGLDVLLDLFDSSITFRARYQRSDDLLAVTEVLVFDERNPRALAGVLQRLRQELEPLPVPASAPALAARLPAEGAGLTLAELRDADDARIVRTLEGVLERLARSAFELGDVIHTRYFIHAHGTDRAV